jgi:formylmethanofuran dehydrogenase subunit D
MRTSLNSILVVNFLAILASISVAFYSSVITQDFEIYISKDESEYLEDDGVISIEEEMFEEEVFSPEEDTVSVDIDQGEGKVFASPAIEDL